MTYFGIHSCAGKVRMTEKPSRSHVWQGVENLPGYHRFQSHHWLHPLIRQLIAEELICRNQKVRQRQQIRCLLSQDPPRV